MCGENERHKQQGCVEKMQAQKVSKVKLSRYRHADDRGEEV
jgi:hypothetical protein